MNIVPDFLEFLSEKYPHLAAVDLKAIAAENLVSPFTLELSSSVLEQAKSFVSSIFGLRTRTTYLKHYQDQLSKLHIKDPGNHAVMMSYDFHLNSQNELRLIEINTNASFLALGTELYSFRKTQLPVPSFSYRELKQCIEQELKLQNKVVKSDLQIAIMDDKPQEQKLYLEFLLYQEIFRTWGWRPAILDFREDWSPYDVIYNRFTDFYLSGAESSELKECFNSRKVCLSPNPHEYFLLADKQRLIDWSEPGFLERMGISSEEIAHIRKGLPRAQTLTPENAEELWSQRRSLFLKPKQSYGSRQTYRGEKISRRLFNELTPQNFIAQEYVAPPERRFSTPDGDQDFKFDLRVFAYEENVQLVVGRIFQGQVTNLRTPYGGFACVKFN